MNHRLAVEGSRAEWRAVAAYVTNLSDEWLAYVSYVTLKVEFVGWRSEIPPSLAASLCIPFEHCVVWWILFRERVCNSASCAYAESILSYHASVSSL